AARGGGARLGRGGGAPRQIHGAAALLPHPDGSAAVQSVALIRGGPRRGDENRAAAPNRPRAGREWPESRPPDHVYPKSGSHEASRRGHLGGLPLSPPRSYAVAS